MWEVTCTISKQTLEPAIVMTPLLSSFFNGEIYQQPAESKMTLENLLSKPGIFERIR